MSPTTPTTGVQNHLTGYPWMSLWGNTATDYFYPDPLLHSFVVPSSTSFAVRTLQKSFSIFTPGDKDAIIRSIVIRRDRLTTAPVVRIHDFDLTTILWSTLPFLVKDTVITGWDLFCPGGFGIWIKNTPYLTVSFQVLDQKS